MPGEGQFEGGEDVPGLLPQGRDIAPDAAAGVGPGRVAEGAADLLPLLSSQSPVVSWK